MAAMSVEAQRLLLSLQIDVDQAEELVRKRDVIHELLTQLRDLLIEEKKGSRDDIATSLEEQRSLNDRWVLAQLRTRTKQAEVDRLDVRTPELLQVTGTDSVREVKWTVRNPKPRITFHLNTIYPIRDINLMTSEWAREKTKSWANGGTNFIGVVKAKKRFSNISASVKLYGWPCEIHRLELDKKQEELYRLRLDEEEVGGQLQAVNASLQKLESTDKAYEEASKQCSEDLKKVRSLERLAYVDPKKLELYIATDSIYGLAMVLELKSMISISSPLARGINIDLAWPLLQGQIEVIRRMQTHVSQVSRLVGAIAQNKYNTETAFEKTEEAVLRHVIKFTTVNNYGHMEAGSFSAQPKIPVSDHNTTDDEQNTLNQKSRDALAKIQKDAEAFQKEKAALFAESRRERLEQFREANCQLQAREAADEVELDSNTNEAVRKKLLADKYHVAILATIKSSQTTAEAVASIWRAERLRLAEERHMLAFYG